MESVALSIVPTGNPLAEWKVPLTRTKRGTVAVGLSDSCANTCPTQRAAITVAIRAMTQRMDFAPEFGVVRFRAGINSKIPDRRYVGATLYIPSSTPSTPAPALECVPRSVFGPPAPSCTAPTPPYMPSGDSEGSALAKLLVSPNCAHVNGCFLV